MTRHEVYHLVGPTRYRYLVLNVANEANEGKTLVRPAGLAVGLIMLGQYCTSGKLVVDVTIGG